MLSQSAQDAIAIMQATAEIVCSNGAAPAAPDKRLTLMPGSRIRLPSGQETTVSWIGVAGNNTPGLCAVCDNQIYALTDIEAL